VAAATSTAEWLAAGGTVGAVAFALLFQAFAPWWLRPKLLIRHGATPERVVREDGTWWDIRIVNRGRGRSAIAAQMMLTHVKEPEREPEAPIALRSLKWTHLNEEAEAEVPAGISRAVEFGKKSPDSCCIELGLFPEIDDPPRARLEQPGAYTFDLSLVAANATPRNYWFKVTLRQGGVVEFGEIVAEPLWRRVRRALAIGIGLSRAPEPVPPSQAGG
jgi:hypothetical protein